MWALQPSISSVCSKGHPWISHTVQWEPTEHAASFESTPNFINPVVVKGHPGWSLPFDVTRFSILPKVISSHVPESPIWVPAPPTSGSMDEQAQCSCKNWASRRRLVVTIVTNPEDKRTDKEDHGGEGIGEVKTNKLTESISYHWKK